MNKNDKFNGWYCYGTFPELTVKANFIEEFMTDYYPELHCEQCYFMSINIGRKHEYGLIGNGYYIPITCWTNVETYKELSDRLLYSNAKMSIMPNTKSTYEDFEKLVSKALDK